MNFLAIAKKTIPPPKNSVEVLYKDGDTKDIMAAIKYGDSLSQGFTKNFAKYLKGKSILETAKKIFDFVLFNIKYVRDPNGIQDIKSPSAVLHSGYADCKSLSLFTGSILKNLNIPFVYRFAAYVPGSTYPTHVYIVAKDENGKDVIIDPVYKRFNQQKSYTYKEDLMTKIRYISGLPGENEVGRLNFRMRPLRNRRGRLVRFRDEREIGRFSFKNMFRDIKRATDNFGRMKNKEVKKISDHWASQEKKFGKWAKQAGTDVGRFVLKTFPITMAFRHAIIAVIRVNVNNMAKKLYQLFKSEDEMRRAGLTPDEIRTLIKNRNAIKLKWDEIGGDHAILEKCIKQGRKEKPIFIFNNPKNDIGYIGFVDGQEIGVLPAAIAAAWATAQGWIAGVSAVLAPIIGILSKLVAAGGKIKKVADAAIEVREQVKERLQPRSSAPANEDNNSASDSPAQSSDTVDVEEVPADEEEGDNESVGFII